MGALGASARREMGFNHVTFNQSLCHICNPQRCELSPAPPQGGNLAWAEHIMEWGGRAGAPKDHSRSDWH